LRNADIAKKISCTMKRLLILLMVFLPALAVADRVRIGVILPLSGEAASYGTQFKSGIELSPNFSQFDFIFEDSRFDRNTALTAFQKLKTIDRVSAVISFGGATCEVLNREAQRVKIIHISAGCNTAEFKTPESFNFRLDVNEDIAATQSAEYLADQKIKKISLVYINNSWGDSIISQMKRALSANNIIVALDLPFAADGSLDFTTVATKVRASQSDLVFLISLPNITPLILRQFKNQNISIPIMSNISVENPEVIRQSGSLADGITYLSVKPDPRSRDQFPIFYSQFPQGNPFVAWGFDSVLLVSLAHANPDPAQRLRSLSDFIGAFNSYTFDSFGELHLPYEIRQIQAGRYVTRVGL
jgi:branched-chain amino acid transport system substrate-binding protein